MSGPKKTAGPTRGGSMGPQTCRQCGALYEPPMERCPECGEPLPERATRIGPGTVFDGKYQIVSLLGSGGMGDVFKARHLQLNAIRTIKVLRSNLLADEWYRNRFLREARLATQVHHPNVAIVHDFSTLPNGSYYMVSEYIDGLTVRQWLKRYGPLPLGLAVEIVSQVLSGLGHCHRRGLLHRDISPDNIMISVDPEDHPVAKIIDLGIAKQVAGPVADATQTGMFMGNPKYCSPEQLGQLREGEEIDLRTDLYSMGMVLFEMVTGASPFQSTTPQGFFIKHLTEAPPPLSKVKPDVAWPEGFEQVILKALEKDRSHRYSTAFDFAAALRPFAVDLSRGLSATFGLRLDWARASDPTERLVRSDSTPGSLSTPGSAQTPDSTYRYRSQRDLEEYLKKEEQEREFSRAQADGSESAWRSFLDRHPDSARREEALRQLTEARSFEEAGRVDSREIWETFLANWPQSRHREEARRRAGQSEQKENETLERARSAGSAQAYREFLTKHANSPLAAKARDLLEEQLGFEAADEKDTERSWEDFLRRWPSGANAAAAGARQEQARNREEEALQSAIRDGTSGALQAFLQKYPDGRTRREAQERLQEATDYEAAAADASPGAWQEFLNRHPQSGRREEAGRMLSEAQLFQEAAQTDSREAWEKFLASSPQSRHRSHAQERLEQAVKRETEALERASSKGSVTAYREFLTKYPRSPLAAKAGSLLEEQLAFEAAREKDTERSWEDFLRRWPSGANAAAAGKRRDGARRREEEALENAIRAGTSGALRHVLEAYPEAKTRRRAEEHLREAVAFEAAGADGKAGWQRFLETYPNGAHAETAKAKLQQLETDALLAEIGERERQQQQADLERLVKAHPASSQVGAAARQALTRLQEAAERKRREEEEESWRFCEASGTEEAWQGFIEKYPGSSRIKAARKKLSKAKAKAREIERAASSAPKAPPPAAPQDLRPTVPLVRGRQEETALEKTRPLARADLRPAPAGTLEERTLELEAAAPRRPAERKSRRGAYIAVAAAALLAVIAVLWRTHRKPEAVEGTAAKVASSTASTSTTETAPPPTAAPPAQMGLLVVDALPWGQVDRIEDSVGKNWVEGTQAYTPLAVAVAPGKYSILVTSANFPGKRLSLSAQIRPGETAKCVGRFEPIDPKAYFEAQGWKP